MKSLFHGVIAWLTFSIAVSASAQVESETSEEFTYDQLVEMVKSGTNDEKAIAAAELAEYGDRIDEFIIPLADLFAVRDDVVHDATKRVFRFFGPQALEAIGETLESENPDVFRRQCSAINAIGDPALQYQPQLLEILDNSTDRNTRMAATYALTGFSAGSADAIEKIVADLDNADMNARLFACRLIIKTGAPANVAIPGLVNLLENGVISDRGFAAWSLGAIGPTNQFDSVPVLVSMLDRFNVVERERALIGLGLLGLEARSATGKVRELMYQDGSNLEGHAALALWQITGDVETSVERLIELSQRVDFEVKGLELLGQMGPAAVDSLDFLTERVQALDPGIRARALDAIGEIGPVAVTHRRQIAARLEDEDPLVRLAATAALKKIDGE